MCVCVCMCVCLRVRACVRAWVCMYNINNTYFDLISVNLCKNMVVMNNIDMHIK